MKLTKKATQRINNYILNNSYITTDQLVEYIRPHYSFDARKAKEQELKRVANRMLKRNGKKVFFATNNLQYVNIEQTDNIEDLAKVYERITKQYKALNNTSKRIEERAKIIGGQLTIEGLA